MKKLSTVKINIDEIREEVEKDLESVVRCNVSLYVYSDGEYGISEYSGNRSLYQIIDGEQEIAQEFILLHEGEDLTVNIDPNHVKKYYSKDCWSEGEGGEIDVDWDKVAEKLVCEGHVWDNISENLENRVIAHNQNPNSTYLIELI